MRGSNNIFIFIIFILWISFFIFFILNFFYRILNIKKKHYPHVFKTKFFVFFKIETKNNIKKHINLPLISFNKKLVIDHF